MRWPCCIVLGVAACASAGDGEGRPGTPPDAPAPPDAAAVDAAVPDAAPAVVTLSQNQSTAATGGSFACTQKPGNYTRASSYYRVFPLADHGVTGALEVQAVTFAVQRANAGGAAVEQAAQVRVGRYDGIAGAVTIDPALIAPLAAAPVRIPDTSAASSVTVPISAMVPAGANLVVELAIPDGAAAQNVFFIGTNAAGETKPAYLRAPICGFSTPRSMNVIAADNNLPRADAILTVTGLAH